MLTRARLAKPVRVAAKRQFSLLAGTITQANDALVSGSSTSQELTRACIEKIESTRDLNAFITETPELALEQAFKSDARNKTQRLSPLDGIPIAVKDIFCTEGVRTTCGSKMLSDFIPPYESTVTSRLWDAGAVCLGKVNMDEFAMGSANIYSFHGPAINPWSPVIQDGQHQRRSPALVPGGSSGGSAVAVASGACFAALGSDTGGSVRQPAAFCGIVGLKPTYGLISRYGLISYASSLDTVGILARSVADTALVLDCIAGPDEMDSTCIQKPDISPLSHFDAAIQSKDMKGLVVGVPDEYYVEELPKVIHDSWSRAAEWLEDAGAVVKRVSLPTTESALPAYYIIASAEASSNLARYDGVRYGPKLEETEDSAGEKRTLKEHFSRVRSKHFGEEVKRRILSGCFVLSEGAYSDYYERALVLRQRIRDDFDKVFQSGVDIILTPTAPTLPFPLDATINPVEMFVNDIMTIPSSLAGLPAASVPVGVTERNSQGQNFPLPIGIQLLAAPLQERKLLRACTAIEARANFPTLIPDYVHC